MLGCVESSTGDYRSREKWRSINEEIILKTPVNFVTKFAL
jgi:hypothetical protein